MRIAYRSLAVAYALVLLAFHADAQSELFPRPAELEPAVQVLDARLHRDRHEVGLHPRRSCAWTSSIRRCASPTTWARASGAGASSAPQKRRATILTKLAGGARAGLEQRRRARAEAVPRGHEQRRVPCRRGARCASSSGNRIGSAQGLVRSGTWKPYIHEVLAKRGLAARARGAAARRVVVRSDGVLEGRRGRHVAVHALDGRALHAHRPHRRRAPRSVLRDRRRGAAARRQLQRHSVVAARVDGLQPRPRRHAPRRAAAENHRHRDDRRQVPEPLVRLRVAELLHGVPRGARDRLESRALLSEPEDRSAVGHGDDRGAGVHDGRHARRRAEPARGHAARR